MFKKCYKCNKKIIEYLAVIIISVSISHFLSLGCSGCKPYCKLNKDTTNRFYIVPNDNDSWNKGGVLKIFANNYEKNAKQYRDLGIYYDKTDNCFVINSKGYGMPPADISFRFNDNHEVWRLRAVKK